MVKVERGRGMLSLSGSRHSRQVRNADRGKVNCLDQDPGPSASTTAFLIDLKLLGSLPHHTQHRTMPLSDKDTTPTPGSSTVAPPPGAKYRGAVVDVSPPFPLSPSSTSSHELMGQDLQLPPAFCLPHDAPLAAALEAAYEREFDQLP